LREEKGEKGSLRQTNYGNVRKGKRCRKKDGIKEKEET
jgi:hypothetical protein